REIRKNYINNNGPIQLLIESTNISNDAKKEFNKRRLKILGEEIPEIPDPISESSDNFNKLEKEIKNIKLSDILKLVDNNDIYQKIIKSNLSEKDISILQKLRKEQLSKLIEKQYNKLENIINTSKDIDELNELKSIIDDSFLSESQKEKLENNRLEKIENLKPIEKPENSLNSLESEEDLENLKNHVINNKLLLRNQKDDIVNLIKNKLDKTKGEERLQKENNRKYNTIKKNINKFLTLETLDKFIIENIDSLNEQYLTDNRNIKDCNDLYLLSDEYYNKIYRNIEDLNEAYLFKDNTKSNLHQIREKRKDELEKEDI
ncbi:12262_t:CDS:2, partial [Cetraspora pellucida]